jgi:hypothetical protein
MRNRRERGLAYSFAKLYREELSRWAEVMKVSGAKAD